jgi:ATP-dependent Lhr-like helicase
MTDDILTRFSPATADWFRGASPRPRGPAGRLGGDLLRAARPRRRADRVGQDPVGLPLGARPARHHPRPPEAGALPGGLRLAAQGAGRRRRAQPALPAGRHRPRRTRLGVPTRPDVTVAVRSGDTPAAERRVFAKTPPTSSSRPPSRSSCCSPPRPASRSPGSRRSSSTRSTPSPAPNAEPIWRSPGAPRRPVAYGPPADRVVRHGAPDRGGRPLPGRRPAGRRRGAPLDQGVGPAGGRPGARPRVARRTHRRPVRAGCRRPPRTSIWPHVEERIVDLVAAAPLHPGLRQLATAGRAPHHPAQRDLGGPHRRRGARDAPECRHPEACRRLRGAPDEGRVRKHGIPAQVMAQSGQRGARRRCSPEPTTAR